MSKIKNKVTLRGLVVSAGKVITEFKKIGLITYDGYSKQLYKVAMLEQLLASEKEKLFHDVRNINHSVILKAYETASEQDKKDLKKTDENTSIFINQKINEAYDKGNQFSPLVGVGKDYVDEHYSLVTEIINSATEDIMSLTVSEIDYKSVKTALLLDTGQESPKHGYVFDDRKFRLLFTS